MPVTILVADDSATMRSILEMTFAGEDARVVTVDGGAAALEKALDLRPDIVIADLSMEMDGYDVARAIKSKLAGTPVIVLSSQHTPYDEAKGRDAGVDEQIVKPFDTQNMIDRVLRLAAAPRATAAVAPPPAQPHRESQQAAPRVQTAPFAAPVAAARPPQPASSAPPGTVTAPRPGMMRAATVAFGATPIGPPSAPAAPRVPAVPVAPAPGAAPRPPAMAAPASPPVVHHAPAPAAHAAPVAAHAAPVAARPAAVVDAATSALSGKLSGLNLTPQQADAVLALSREVIERVVWEVVPDLAETLIREELKRLTAEG